MGRLRLILLLLICFSEGINSFKNFRKIKKLVEQTTWKTNTVKDEWDLSYSLKPPKVDYPEKYLEQPLDNFDPLIQSTYKQRYWANTDLWQKPNGPVFLYIGGEGALSAGVVEKGEHVDLAKKYGALIFAVEHRYYGKSINSDGLALENMKYLSSQQALADLANFHTFATKTYNLTEANTWICFGGSYPGSLSAWFRLKYPHLVYGAISSSAPVRAVVNFEGYNDVVKNSLSEPLINGSSECASSVMQAFQTVDTMLENRQNAELSKHFNSCQLIVEEADVYNFVSEIADVFMGTVQYNKESPKGMNVSDICKVMTNASYTPYENLRRLNGVFEELFRGLLGGEKEKCRDYSWATFIKEITNTTLGLEGGVGARQWLYQTCSQFGYYQTCDEGTSCLFSRHMSLDKFLRVCSEVFAIPGDEVYERVEFTNSYYGSDQPRGTRIVFVNGSVDPWHALSVLKNISATETAIFIPGTAHCANMHSEAPDDPPQLIEARKMIDSQIGQWLKDAGYHNNKANILRFKPHIY